MIHLQSNNKQQIIADGYPYLRKNCILCCSIELLDMQVLLDPFEERLDSPTLLVEFCNGNCWKDKVISQESIHNVLSIVFICNQSQYVWIFLGSKQTSETDCFIRDNTSLSINLSCLENIVLHIILCSGNKVCMLLLKDSEQPIKIDISVIHKVIGACFDWQHIHSLAIMYIARSKENKVRYTVLNINQSMHFECSFIMMELCPRTKLQTKINGTTVKSIDHVVDVQAVIIILIKGLSSIDKYPCIVLINTPVFLFVHISKSRLWYDFQPRMVQFGVECSKLSFYASKTCTASKLSITHDKKLSTASATSCVKIPSISVNTFPEFVIRDALRSIKNKPEAEQILILKSWNEWGEGNYMEPDLRYGHGFIQALRKALDDFAKL